MKMKNAFPYMLPALLISFALFSCHKKENTVLPKPIPVDSTHVAAWQLAAPPIAAANVNSACSLAVDKDGVIYLAFQDGNMGGKASVVKLADSSWASVGVAGFSAGTANNPAIIIDQSSGTPYIVYNETSSTYTDKIVVMRFNGNTWEPVGTTLFQASHASTPEIVLDNAGMPYVSYTSYLQAGNVMKYDGTAWSSYFSSGSVKKVLDISMSTDANYVAYMWDTSLGDNHFTVVHNTGAAAGTDLNFPFNVNPNSFSLYTDKSGTIYLIYEGSGPGYRAGLKKFYGSWSDVGNTNFSAGIAANPTMFISSDSVNTAYALYKDGNDKLTVMYDSVNVWKTLGYNLLSSSVSHTSLVVGKENTPYVAFTDKTTGSIIVMKYK